MAPMCVFVLRWPLQPAGCHNPTKNCILSALSLLWPCRSPLACGWAAHQKQRWPPQAVVRAAEGAQHAADHAARVWATVGTVSEPWTHWKGGLLGYVHRWGWLSICKGICVLLKIQPLSTEQGYFELFHQLMLIMTMKSVFWNCQTQNDGILVFCFCIGIGTLVVIFWSCWIEFYCLFSIELCLVHRNLYFKVTWRRSSLRWGVIILWLHLFKFKRKCPQKSFSSNTENLWLFLK